MVIRKGPNVLVNHNNYDPQGPTKYSLVQPSKEYVTCVNWCKTKHYVRHNGMMIRNSLIKGCNKGQPIFFGIK